MRSLSAIHSSACSCGGIASHRFSIPARVGFEMACAERVCCVVGVRCAFRQAVGAERKGFRVRRIKGEEEGRSELGLGLV